MFTPYHSLLLNISSSSQKKNNNNMTFTSILSQVHHKRIILKTKKTYSFRTNPPQVVNHYVQSWFSFPNTKHNRDKQSCTIVETLTLQTFRFHNELIQIKLCINNHNSKKSNKPNTILNLVNNFCHWAWLKHDNHHIVTFMLRFNIKVLNDHKYISTSIEQKSCTKLACIPLISGII